MADTVTTQYVKLMAKTDANGYFTYTFPNTVGSVIVGANEPQAGQNAGLISASATMLNAKTVKIRAWVSGPNWTAVPANKKNVVVTLLGITQGIAPPPPPPPGDPLYTLSTLDHAETPNMDSLVVGSNDGGATVRQEVWNPDASALRKQFTEVWAPNKWRTTINAAKDNTAVNSYPDVSSLVTDTDNRPVPFANYAAINSSWSVNCHETAATNAQAAYDIWLKDYDLELMIWVDTHGADRQPAGDDTGIDVTFDNVAYRLWAESDNSTISFVRKTNARTGSIDIRAVIQYLIDQKRYPASVGINMFCFGFETPSTGGIDEIFEVLDYTLVTKPVAGKVV
jgi:hypothetical protein